MIRLQPPGKAAAVVLVTNYMLATGGLTTDRPASATIIANLYRHIELFFNTRTNVACTVICGAVVATHYHAWAVCALPAQSESSLGRLGVYAQRSFCDVGGDASRVLPLRVPRHRPRRRPRPRCRLRRGTMRRPRSRVRSTRGCRLPSFRRQLASSQDGRTSGSHSR